MVLRPMLRPGSVLLRRDVDHLQVGTSPGRIVRDDPGVAVVLRSADGVRTASELARIAAADGAADGTAVVAQLIARGALVSATLGGRRLRVDLRHDAGGARLARTVRALIGDHAAPADDPAALVVAISTGEPSRTTFRALLHHGIAHLPVALVDDQVRVGPLVLPGHSPCLDCHDLHRARLDPAWSALVPQFGAVTPAHPGASLGVLASATGEIARVVAALQSGRRALEGRARLLGPGPHDVHDTTIGFHHGCGCGLLAA